MFRRTKGTEGVQKRRYLLKLKIKKDGRTTKKTKREKNECGECDMSE